METDTMKQADKAAAEFVDRLLVLSMRSEVDFWMLYKAADAMVQKLIQPMI